MVFPAFLRLRVWRHLAVAGLALAFAGLVAPHAARAEALLLIEADSGKVLQAENATYPWYPASLTKLMTAYVTLKAVKDGRISLDTLFTVSANAAAQAPSKMGFPPGTQLTVDNALKMMMVKSANDMAVVLAEGLDGSVASFAAEMNRTAQRLGMTQTTYVNPNGLPDDGQITSARDMAILARAMFRDLPEYEYFSHIQAIKFGRRITANYNKLIGRYPGADGMKTGFICASGFNLVASATRNNKRLIAVVLGTSSGKMRAVKAAQLLEKGFQGSGMSWLRPSLGTVNALTPIQAAPPNLREEMCGPKRKRPASETEDEGIEINLAASANSAAAFAATASHPSNMTASELIAAAAAPVDPVIVYTGPARTGAAIAAADAAETARQTAQIEKRRSAKAAAAAKRKAAAKKPAATANAKPPTPAAKPAASHTKPAASHTKPAASHAKPAASHAKPAASHGKPAHSKPAHPKSAADRAKQAAGQALSLTPRKPAAKPASGSGTATAVAQPPR